MSVIAPGRQFINEGLAYIASGFPVLPVTADKEPIIRGGANAASMDPEQIAAWGWKYRGADIGILIPDGLFVLDVDVHRGKRGREEFVRLSGGLEP
jgi:hypothetical protein